MGARTGVVLAGGYSTRFGEEDKALAEVNGESMLALVVGRLAEAVDAVVVSCRPDQQSDFERVLDSLALATPVRFALDPTPDRGPLAGIRQSFDSIDARYAAVVACDMPRIDPAFLSVLFERAKGRDGAVPELPDGHLQPVQAVYRVDAMWNVASARLDTGDASLYGALDALDVVTVDGTAVSSVDALRSLRDVNTREQFHSLDGM